MDVIYKTNIKTLKSEKKKVYELGASGPKEQNGEVYGFSFCLICATFRTKEANNSETPVDKEKKSPKTMKRAN